MANTPLCPHISPPGAGVHTAATTVYKQIRVKEVTHLAAHSPLPPFPFSSSDALAGTEIHFPATPGLQWSSALSALPGGALPGAEEAGIISLQRRADRVRAPSRLTAAEWNPAQTFQHHLLCRHTEALKASAVPPWGGRHALAALLPAVCLCSWCFLHLRTFPGSVCLEN